MIPPFIAKSVGRFVGARLILSIDMMGSRDDMSADKHAEVPEHYVQDLVSLGIRIDTDSLFSTTDPEFVTFVRDRIESSTRNGKLARTSKTLASCSCGKIEVPVEVASELQRQNRMKLIVQEGPDKTPKCKLCNTELVLRERSVLTHQFPHEDFGHLVLPLSHEARMRGIGGQVSAFPIVVSKHNRISRGSITLEDGSVIDPDFCWRHYLGFLKEKFRDKEVSVVIAIDYLAEAYRLASITQQHDPDLQLSFIVHPLIKVSNGTDEPVKLMLEEYLRLCGSAQAAQLFLSLGLQWSRFDSTILLKELDAVKRSTEKLTAPEIPIAVSGTQNLVTALKSLKRDNVLKMLKKLRQGQVLTVDEVGLLHALT